MARVVPYIELKIILKDHSRLDFYETLYTSRYTWKIYPMQLSYAEDAAQSLHMQMICPEIRDLLTVHFPTQDGVLPCWKSGIINITVHSKLHTKFNAHQW